MGFLHGGSINKTYPEPLFIYLSTVQLRGSQEKDSFCTLPDEIQSLRDGIQSKQQKIDQQSQRIVNQILEISQVNQKPIFLRFSSITEPTSFFELDARKV